MTDAEKARLDARIAWLESSLARLDEIDPDEVDEEYYAETLNELVKLREERRS